MYVQIRILDLYLTSLAAGKRLTVLHHSADYIFISFEIIEPIMVTFENRIPLKPVLGVGL